MRGSEEEAVWSEELVDDMTYLFWKAKQKALVIAVAGDSSLRSSAARTIAQKGYNLVHLESRRSVAR
jgi:hypothetical protein